MTADRSQAAFAGRRAPSLPSLDPREMRRYGRHLLLEEVGIEGQRRLKGSRVLLVGAGGLGSPLALYLAAAGVGTLGIIEFDKVEETNLQRQLLHGTEDIGRDKLESAIESLQSINPHVKVEGHPLRLDAGNARELVSAYDVVADGSDNFATRYLVNDACVMEGRPEVYGAVYQFEGQLSVFAQDDGPCYRCLYPEPPPPGMVPSCAEGGVLGVLPGIIGSLQANEVLKLLLGRGRSLVGRLLLFDALAGSFREVRLQRDPHCPVCGEEPRITELVEYEGYCDSAATTKVAQDGSEDLIEPDDPHRISVQELARRRAAGNAPIVLDVRLPQELAIASLEPVLHIPLHLLPLRLEELDREAEIAVLCHHGVRSQQAVQLLLAQGFHWPRNVEGGIDHWSMMIDPAVPRY